MDGIETIDSKKYNYAYDELFNLISIFENKLKVPPSGIFRINNATYLYFTEKGYRKFRKALKDIVDYFEYLPKDYSIKIIINKIIATEEDILKTRNIIYRGELEIITVDKPSNPEFV